MKKQNKDSIKTVDLRPYFKSKVGDFITDGQKVYVLDRDHVWHFVDSGNHAKYHVSHEELQEIIGERK